MISGKALLRKPFYGSKCVVAAYMKAHLNLPNNTAEVVEFRLVFGRRTFKCQAPKDKIC